jgi:hypothetical protein
MAGRVRSLAGKTLVIAPAALVGAVTGQMAGAVGTQQAHNPNGQCLTERADIYSDDSDSSAIATWSGSISGTGCTGSLVFAGATRAKSTSYYIASGVSHVCRAESFYHNNDPGVFGVSGGGRFNSCGTGKTYYSNSDTEFDDSSTHHYGESSGTLYVP